MKKKKLFAMLMAFALTASLTSCGSNDMSNVFAENAQKEVLAEIIEGETVTEETATEEIPSDEDSVADELDESTYKESDCLYMLNSKDDAEITVDMDALKPDGRNYYIVKSINIYNKDASLAGYTKENVSVSVATSNDEWSYCYFDGYNYLVKTKDLMDSIWVDEKKTTDASTGTTEPDPEEVTPSVSAPETPKTESVTATSESVASEPVESAPVLESPVTEQHAAEESDKYTPEEAIVVYRSIMEANGITWDPSIKEFASWGTGFMPLNKGWIDENAYSAVESYRMGDSAGNPWTRYYLEITGSDEDYVYITEWGCN